MASPATNPIKRSADYVREEYSKDYYDMGPRLKPWQEKGCLVAAFGAAVLGAVAIKSGFALGGVALVASSFVILTCAFSRPRNILRFCGNWMREQDLLANERRKDERYEALVRRHSRRKYPELK